MPSSSHNPADSTERARWWALAAAALDVVIVAYAVALALIAVGVGVDFGWLSITQAAKPVLVLWILVPIRLALVDDAEQRRTAAGFAWRRRGCGGRTTRSAATRHDATPD